MNEPPAVSLPRFEGPLDLLLALVRQKEIEITDIPIAEVTQQYLGYLRQAEALDIDLGAEFIYMAAMLIQIKSASLLRQDPEIAAREEDPREELVRQLLDHEQLRHGAEFLKQQLEVAGAMWSRSSIEEFEAPGGEAVSADKTLSLLEVLRLAKEALAVARAYELITPAESVTVEEMVKWIEWRMGADQRAEASALLAQQPDAQHRAALFLAMLDMANNNQIRLDQQQCFGPLWILRYGPTVP
jgi:segregation and condensation protein A